MDINSENATSRFSTIRHHGNEDTEIYTPGFVLLLYVGWGTRGGVGVGGDVAPKLDGLSI